MIDIEGAAPSIKDMEKSRGNVEPQNKLLYYVQGALRAELAEMNNIPANKIGLIGVGTGENGEPVTIAATAKMGSQTEIHKDIYSGISDANVGVPNPVDSLPNLSLVDDRLTPSLEKFEQLHGLSKDQNLTRAMLESGVVDERLSVNDREKIKALLAGFNVDSNIHWLTPSDVNLGTAQALDQNTSKYHQFEKILENGVPEIDQSLKYLTKKFASLDKGSKGYLTSMDYEKALLDPKLDQNDRKALGYGLDHKFFGYLTDIQQKTVDEARNKGLISFSKEWALTTNISSPFHQFATDLQSIRKADEELRLHYLELSTGINNEL